MAAATVTRNPILDECERAGAKPRPEQLSNLSKRGALATRALEIIAKAPEAEEYVELLKKLEMV